MGVQIGRGGSGWSVFGRASLRKQTEWPSTWERCGIQLRVNIKLFIEFIFGVAKRAHLAGRKEQEDHSCGAQ